LARVAIATSLQHVKTEEFGGLCMHVVAEKVLNNAVKVRRTVPPFGVESLGSRGIFCSWCYKGVMCYTGLFFFSMRDNENRRLHCCQVILIEPQNIGVNSA